MLTRKDQDSKSDIEFLKTARKLNNRTFYLAITVIIFVAIIAMTGVCYEVW